MIISLSDLVYQGVFKYHNQQVHLTTLHEFFFSALESMFKNQHLLDLEENRFSPIRDFIGLTLETHPNTPRRPKPFLSLPVRPGRVHGSSLSLVLSRDRVGGGAKGTAVIPCLPQVDMSVCPQPFLYFLLKLRAQLYRALPAILRVVEGYSHRSLFGLSDPYHLQQARSLPFIGRRSCTLCLRFKAPFPSLGGSLSPPW